MKVKCVGCENKFNVTPENFCNYEIVFCPICGLDHQVRKKTDRVTVKAANLRISEPELQAPPSKFLTS